MKKCDMNELKTRDVFKLYTYQSNETGCRGSLSDNSNLYVALYLHKKITYFNNLVLHIMPRITTKLLPKFYSKGQMIFRQGDVGDRMFILLKGEVGVLIGRKIVATILDHKVFGELALEN